MRSLDEEMRELADAGSGEKLAAALAGRFARDPEDPEAWLAAMALDEHPRLRKQSVWRPLVAVLTDASEAVREPALAWETASWLAELRLYLDCPQNATCHLTRFLRRFPSHEGALDRLVRLVCTEDGDYREAWWAVDDLARVAATPERKARVLLALALMELAAFPHEPAKAHTLLDEVRRAGASSGVEQWREWAERSGCGRILDALIGGEGGAQ